MADIGDPFGDADLEDAAGGAPLLLPPQRTRHRIRSQSEPSEPANAGANPKRQRRGSGTIDVCMKDEVCRRVKEIFERIEGNFLSSLVEKNLIPRMGVERNLEMVVGLLLESGKFPLEPKSAPTMMSFSSTSSDSSSKMNCEASRLSTASQSLRRKSLPEDLESYLDENYVTTSTLASTKQHALNVLSDIFYPFRKTDLRKLFHYCKSRLAKTVVLVFLTLKKSHPKVFKLILDQEPKQKNGLIPEDDIVVNVEQKKDECPIKIGLAFLQCWRLPKSTYVPKLKSNALLLKEVAAIDDWLATLRSSISKARKSVCNDESESFECGCCFADSIPFNSLVQCREGHLFCKDCVKRYVESIVAGIGNVDCRCLTVSCSEEFPRTQLEFLDDKLLQSIEDRQGHEAVRRAFMDEVDDELVQCPFCNFRGLVDKDNKVFECQDSACGRESCKLCQQPWDDDHIGRPCVKLETRDESTLRRQVEEELTKARVRDCPGCGAHMLKTTGCNKMECRCGTKSCYACREKVDGYDHFCRHPLDPGKKCVECVKCLLFADVATEDRKTMEEIRAKGLAEWQNRGFKEGQKIATELSPIPPPQNAARPVTPIHMRYLMLPAALINLPPQAYAEQRARPRLGRPGRVLVAPPMAIRLDLVPPNAE